MAPSNHPHGWGGFTTVQQTSDGDEDEYAGKIAFRNQQPYQKSTAVCAILVGRSTPRRRKRWITAPPAPNTSKRLVRRPASDHSPRDDGPNPIKSTEIEMNQLRVRFAEDYYPSNLDRGRSSLEHRSTDLKFNLPIQSFYASRTSLPKGQFSSPSDLALRLAVDAIALAGLASATNNRSALTSAAKIYQAALETHSQAVADAISSCQSYDGKLLVTAQALHFCQQFSGLSEAQGGSVIHIQGLADMIASRGLENMTTEEDDRMFLQYYQQFALRFGLILRRSIHTELAEAWARLDMRFEAPFSQLNHLAIRVPTMLEEADSVCDTLASSQRLCTASEIAPRAAAIVRSLQDQESSLQAWYERTHPCNEEPPYRPIETMEVETIRKEMPSSLRNAFPCAFKFTSFYPAVCHCRFWACLLAIRSAIAVVLHTMTSGNDWSSMNRGVHNVTECADELCQTMMFFMASGNGFAGFMPVAGNLKSVCQWYKRIGAQDKVSWCWHVSRMIKARGFCPPDLSG